MTHGQDMDYSERVETRGVNYILPKEKQLVHNHTRCPKDQKFDTVVGSQDIICMTVGAPRVRVEEVVLTQMHHLYLNRRARRVQLESNSSPVYYQFGKVLHQCS